MGLNECHFYPVTSFVDHALINRNTSPFLNINGHISINVLRLWEYCK